MPQDDPDYSDADAARLVVEMDKAADTTRHSWRIAEQGYSESGFELTVAPWGDGYAMVVGHVGHRQRVYFDAAGRVTHIRDAY
jgi:uncharacterized glyoxalase superfamily protein PhnB